MKASVHELPEHPSYNVNRPRTTVEHAHYTDISLSLYRYLTIIIQISHYHYTYISLSLNRYLTIIKQISHYHYTDISLSLNRYLTIIKQISKNGNKN